MNFVRWACWLGLLGVMAVSVRAAEEAKITDVKVAWHEAPLDPGSDLVWFKGRWLALFVERSEDDSQVGFVRVISSLDRNQWESVALNKSSTPGRGVWYPRFSVTADGRLMITARGIVPTPNVADPLPKFGGTLSTLAWFSEDGRHWSQCEQVAPHNFATNGVVWERDTAFSYGCGCICGSSQTVQIFSSKTGKQMQSVFEQTFSGFFPEEGSLVVAGGRGYCLMSRSTGAIADSGRLMAYFGTSHDGHKDWNWQVSNARIRFPNLLRVTDSHVIAAVGVVDTKPRTVVSRLDLKTGQLIELVEVPTGGRLMPVGLALAGDKVWISYHALEAGSNRLFVSNLTLPAISDR